MTGGGGPPGSDLDGVGRSKKGTEARNGSRPQQYYSAPPSPGTLGPLADASSLTNRAESKPPVRVGCDHHAGRAKRSTALNRDRLWAKPPRARSGQLAVRGASTKQISQALYISEYTVKDHLSNIFERVGVRGRRALVKQLYLNTIFP